MKTKIYTLLAFLALANITNAQIDRSKAPQPGPAPVIQIGDYTKFELANGLKVFVVENHRLPKVSFSLSFVFDQPLEKENAGIGKITSALIGTGTKNRTKDQINEAIDYMGASLDASASGIAASSLKKYSDKVLEIMSDVAMNSIFNLEELEKKRTQTLSGITAGKDDADEIANNVFPAVIYGKQHPYGEFETESSVKGITLAMCNNYYRLCFS